MAFRDGRAARTLGRSGGTSDTMLWLVRSLLVVVGRFPPALLDMSKADIFKSNFLFSSGTWPVSGCRNVFRLSLWLMKYTAPSWVESISQPLGKPGQEECPLWMGDAVPGCTQQVDFSSSLMKKTLPPRSTPSYMFLVMKAAFDSKGELPLRSTGEEACPFAAPELRGLGAARGQTPHRSPTPNLVKHLLRPIHQSHLPTPMTSEDLNHQDRCQDASRENTSNQSAPCPT